MVKAPIATQPCQFYRQTACNEYRGSPYPLKVGFMGIVISEPSAEADATESVSESFNHQGSATYVWPLSIAMVCTQERSNDVRPAMRWR